MSRLVVALGGNALLPPDADPSIGSQRRAAADAASVLAPALAGHEVVLTHGNGPQVGLLALMEDAYEEMPPAPLDVLGAETEGMIGYILELAFSRELGDRSVVTILSRVEVDADDPAFDDPSKPIGPIYGPDEAARLAEDRGWVLKESRDGLRRVVPSPAPRRMVNLDAVDGLLAGDRVVICAGGGGIPIACRDGRWEGAEAVVDKDAVSALLATSLEADRLVLLTDVGGVFADWSGDRSRLITRANPDALGRMDLAAGSMGPKVQAAIDFVRASGREAVIGSLDQGAEVLAGQAGTLVTADVDELEVRNLDGTGR